MARISLLAGRAGARLALGAWTGSALAVGYWAGSKDVKQSQRQLPSGFRACCDSRPLTTAQEELRPKLAEIVGSKNVKSSVSLSGARLGHGEAFAVVNPGTIQEAIDVLQACVDADVCVLPQGANTGLTGGSVPRGHEAGVDRPTVVINNSRLKSVMPIDDGERMVCLAGAGIYDVLTKAGELGRESHSVLGSIFLNPTTAAGVAFGSGGTQTRKGPVYTERLLYARVNGKGKVEVVNSLGLKGETRELYQKLEEGTLSQSDVDEKCALQASMTKYSSEVCKSEKSVARFNASTEGPQPCRSEGKVLILASVHDTFPKPTKSTTVWVSCKDLLTAQQFKRDVCFAGGGQDMPRSCEYMDRDAFRAVNEAGRVACWLIRGIGIGPTLKKMWDIKLQFESLPIPFAGVIIEKSLYMFNNLFPAVLPKPVMELTADFDHHIAITMGEYGSGEHDRFMERLKKFAEAGTVKYYSCDPKEEMQVNYFRFTAASAFRTWCIGKGVEGVSVDYALPKNEATAPPMHADQIELRMRYSHFGCNVVHEDIAFKEGVDVHAAKMDLKHTVDSMGGRLPAEHGHGTEYIAPPDTRSRWQEMDPLNVFNPGVGGLSTAKRYG